MYDDSFKLRYRVAPVAVYENVDSGDTKAHIHKEIEMLYILEGSTVAKIGEESFKAGEGDIIFVNPLEVHSLTTDTSLPYRHKCICFDLSMIADKNMRENLLSGSTYIMHHLCENTACLPQLRENFLQLFEAAQKDDATLLFESTAYVSLIFVCLISNSLLIRSDKTQKSAEFCKKVIKYISENYSEDITSKDAAKEFFYTQSYFCRTFQQNFGVSFSEYLNMYRIFTAKDMLKDSCVKIADVAFLCGFKSSEYFARCFKKQVGVTPSEHKKVNTVHKTG